jgi:hypothetical protein
MYIGNMKQMQHLPNFYFKCYFIDRVVTANMPQPRPRGMGLGADTLASLSVPSPASQEEGEELKVIKGAYVQIISGSHRGQYGQVRLCLLHFLFLRIKV